MLEQQAFEEKVADEYRDLDGSAAPEQLHRAARLLRGGRQASVGNDQGRGRSRRGGHRHAVSDRAAFGAPFIVVRGARAAQPPEPRRPHPARPPGRDHGALGLGQVLARLRHALRRGPAPLRRVALGLRAPVPRADGEARRRLDRRPLAGDRDRAAHGRPGTRARRSAPSPRSTTTCGCSSRGSGSRTARLREADREPDRAADHRPRARRSARARASQILAPVVRDRKGEYRKELESFRRQGFVAGAHRRRAARARRGDRARARRRRHSIDVVVDRLVVKRERARAGSPSRSRRRCAWRAGSCGSTSAPGEREHLLSERNACPDCGVSYPEIAPRMFSFNSPHGACPACDGLGTRRRVRRGAGSCPTSRSRSREGAIAPWSGRRMPRYYGELLAGLAAHYGVSLDTPWSKLPERGARGDPARPGDERDRVPRHPARRQRRVRAPLGRRARRARAPLRGGLRARARALARYRSERPCPACEGTRLRPEARARAARRRLDHRRCVALSVGPGRALLRDARARRRRSA